MTPDILVQFSSDMTSTPRRAGNTAPGGADKAFRKTLEAEGQQAESSGPRPARDEDRSRAPEAASSQDADSSRGRPDHPAGNASVTEDPEPDTNTPQPVPFAPVPVFTPLTSSADPGSGMEAGLVGMSERASSDRIMLLNTSPGQMRPDTLSPVVTGTRSTSGPSESESALSGVLESFRQAMSGTADEKMAQPEAGKARFSREILNALSQPEGQELKAVTQGGQNLVQALQRQDTTPVPVWVSQLPARAGSDAWQHQLGEKVMWLVGQKLHQARIHLNPADLGPIDIQIQIHKDQAQIQVHATHAVTRDMLDAAAWRLRETLAGQGLNLSGFDVSDQPAWQQPEGEGGQPMEEGSVPGDRLGAVPDDSADKPVLMRVTSVPGLVDTYA